MGETVTTTTATGCAWSFPEAAEAREAASGGSVGLPEGDTGLRPDAPSTGSSCRVGRLNGQCTEESRMSVPFIRAWITRKLWSNVELQFVCSTSGKLWMNHTYQSMQK